MKPRCDLVGVEKKPRPSGRRAGPSHICLTLDYSRKARPSLPHRKQLGARGLVPEERPRRSGAKYTSHQLAEGGVFRPSAAGQFGNSERGDLVPTAASGLMPECCRGATDIRSQIGEHWIVGTSQFDRDSDRPPERPRLIYFWRT